MCTYYLRVRRITDVTMEHHYQKLAKQLKPLAQFL